MYYTGLDPMTMKSVYVPRSPGEKAMQRALLQYSDPRFAPLVRQALLRAGREDLIGNGRNALVRPGPLPGGDRPGKGGGKKPAAPGKAPREQRAAAPRGRGAAPGKGRK